MWVFQQEVCHIQQCSGASKKSTNLSVDVQNATLSHDKLFLATLNMTSEHHLGTSPRDMTSDNDLRP